MPAQSQSNEIVQLALRVAKVLYNETKDRPVNHLLDLQSQ